MGIKIINLVPIFYILIFLNWGNAFAGLENQSTSNSIKVRIIDSSEFISTRLSLINSAKEKIWISQYIFETDSVGRIILDHLIAAKSENPKLDIRILIDGVGPSAVLPFTNQDLIELKNANLLFRVYNPKLFVHKIRNRMHEKLFIVDDKVIIGSSSLWKESLANIIELDLLVYGQKIIEQVQAHFLSQWGYSSYYYPSESHSHEFETGFNVSSQNRLRQSKIIKKLEMKNLNLTSGFTELNEWSYIYDTAKNKSKKKVLNSTVELLNKAKNQITIVTAYPYFPNEIKSILVQKRSENIPVQIITTSFSILGHEHVSLREAFKTQVGFFLRNGIDLFVFQGFLHQKVILIDDSSAFIGSFNFDVLGSEFNTENGLILYNQHKQNSDFFKQLFDNNNKMKNNSILMLPEDANYLLNQTCSEYLCGAWKIYYPSLQDERY